MQTLCYNFAQIKTYGTIIILKDGLVCSEWTNNDYPATVMPFALEETVTTLYDWFMASQLNVQRNFFYFVANFVNQA